MSATDNRLRPPQLNRYITLRQIALMLAGLFIACIAVTLIDIAMTTQIKASLDAGNAPLLERILK